jgi:hypothetical protein
MTWELAESGEHFITTVINGADLVPTFSAAAVDDLRSEVPYFYFFFRNAIAANSIGHRLIYMHEIFISIVSFILETT